MQSILISGGGIIGLSAACALAQQGFTITLIESQLKAHFPLPDPQDDADLRVVALNHASHQLLTDIQAWPIIEKSRYCAYERMQVWDNVADGQVIFTAQENGEHTLGAIVEQKVLLGALWQKVRETPSIRIIEGCQIIEVTSYPQHICVTLSDNTEITALLCIVAEGAHSPLRKLIGIETKTQTYHQSAIVATIRSTQPHQKIAFQRFASDGPLAWLPLWDPFLTSIVWTTSPEKAQILCELPEDQFNQCLMRESAGILGELSIMSERRSFVLNRQHAKQYGAQRCILIGDAAHTMHPLAGQGVNCGFRDLRCLLESINIAKQKNRDIGSDRLIQHYQRHARWANQAALSVMEVFHRGFAIQHPGMTGIRNLGLNLVNQSLKLRQWFMKAAQGAF